MKKEFFLIAVLIILFISTGSGQTQPTATIGFAHPVNATSNHQTEVSISINKTKPKNLLVSTNTNDGSNSSHDQSYYYTTDGGITWFGDDAMPNGNQSLGDPSTAFDAAGNAYLTLIDRGGSNPDDRYNVIISNTQGLTWGAIHGGNLTHGDADHDADCGGHGCFDKEMTAAVDEMQTSSYVNYYYCAWTDFTKIHHQVGRQVKTNRSTDQGLTFDHELALSAGWGQGANVQTGPNGEIYICWADYTNGGQPAQNIGFAKSTNGGVSYTSSLAFAYRGTRVTSGADASYNDTRINDFPSMAVDKSCGPNRGRIYIAYPELRTLGSVTSEIRVRFSDNQGASWSDASTINIGASRESWFPWIAVDDMTGLVNVAYFCMDQTNGFSTNTYVAYADGNVTAPVSPGNNLTWQNIKVSPNAHNTEQIFTNNSYAGDYIGLTSFGGHSYASWMENTNVPNVATTNGFWHVWVARIDYNSTQLTSSQTDLAINNPIISRNENFAATNKIEIASGNTVTIKNTAVSDIKAGQSISIIPASGKYFEIEAGAVATLHIAPSSCTTPGAVIFKSNPDSWASNYNIYKTDVDGMKIFAYPNPANDYIVIGALNKGYINVSLTITDITGRIIASYTKPDMTSEQIRQVVDVSRYSGGLYLATIEADKQKYSIKFEKTQK